ncbi:MAG TPA: class I SAM-dependent methyltransferase [bacterium]|nr:class I SAM-dependent methyltransferase [bacterium]HOL47685.1 class I SAM-dependent methyltransferase [bacterium]HPQ18709.1 class I SAM-dependent methyltransferase [bacterium]
MNTELNCNNCNNNICKIVLSKDNLNLYKCENCNLLFTYPQPDKNFLKTYYSKSYFKHWFEYTNVKKKTDLWRLKLVSKFLKNKKNIALLDFGCGVGYFLNFIKKIFPHWKIYGIEFSDFAINYAQENFQLNILHYNQLNQITDKFDVITLWHTIEHLNDPCNDIKKLKNFLKDDGLIFIETPNVNSLLQKIRGLKSLNLVEHLFHYTPETLQYLFMRHNFKIILNRPGNPGYTRKGIKIFIKKILSFVGWKIFNFIQKNYDDTILLIAKYQIDKYTD